MPFVLVDLGAFGVGLLCLLAAIALDFIVKAIASALPNLSILGVGLNLAKMFRDAGDTVLNWCVNNTKALWHDVENWVSAHAFLLDSAFGAVVQEAHYLGDQIAHIVTSSIPNAIKATESYVGKELVSLKKGIEGDISAAATKVEAIVAGDVRTIDATISTDIGNVEGDITRAVTKAISTAEDYTDTAIHKVEGYVDQSVTTAENLASSALATAKSQITGAIDAVASTAASDLASAVGSLESEIAAAARTAAAATAAVATSVEGEITTAEQQLQQQVQSAIATVTGEVSSIENSVSADLSGLQGLLQAMVAASIAGVLARVAKLEECSVGVCSDSPNNFGNLLQSALGFVSLAGAGAFLAEVINDPAQAEGDYTDVIGGTVNAADSLLHLLEQL